MCGTRVGNVRETACISIGTRRIEAYRARMDLHPDTWTADGVKEPRDICSGLCLHRELSDQATASAFRRRRHQPRRPPPAKIRPGRPAPATGPGTAAAARRYVKDNICS